MPELKYYDKYTSDNANTACNGNDCLSHGLSETLGWYDDSRNMVSEEYPWLLRSGYFYDSTNAGVFGFSAWYLGDANSIYSFRLVMSPIS